MTTTAWPVEQCPSCMDTRTVELAADQRLCLACRHEWAPSTTTGPVAPPVDNSPVPEPALSLAVPDTSAGGAFDDYLSQARDRFVGTEVIVHELEVAGTVERITDDGMAVVEFGSGYSVEVGPDAFSVVARGAVDDDVISALASIDMTVAARIIRAGAETITENGETRGVTLAPDGWLPDEAGVMPVIEHGASYAIATVALAAGVSKADLVAVADRLDAAAQTAEGMTKQ